MADLDESDKSLNLSASWSSGEDEDLDKEEEDSSRDELGSGKGDASISRANENPDKDEEDSADDESGSRANGDIDKEDDSRSGDESSFKANDDTEDIDKEDDDDSSDEDEDYFADVDTKFAHSLLEQTYVKPVGGKQTEAELIEKELIVLDEKGKNSFENLPGGWIEVRHCSGMPLYLHRKTRVCTMAKPYFLGPGSVRRHSIPLSAIPCLAYRRALILEEELAKGSDDPQVSPDNDSDKKESIDKQCVSFESTLPETIKNNAVSQNSNDSQSQSRKRKQQQDEAEDGEVDYEPNNKRIHIEDHLLNGNIKTTAVIPSCPFREHITENPTGSVVSPMSMSSSLPAMDALPLAKVSTAQENDTINSVTPDSLREYCQALFKFKKVKCKRFRTWSARRKHSKEQKRIQLQRPTLPEAVKFISFEVPNGTSSTDNGKLVSKEYILNPLGKSSVCILHEYVQHALRKQPSYIFKELANSANPYAATVVINNMQYGTGYGSSKKVAKAEAAKATLEILIPQMKEQLDGKKSDGKDDFDILTYFEPIEISDIVIAKYCKSFSEPPPYALLLTCLQRNFGQGISSNVKFEMVATGNQANKFRMEVGEGDVKHEVEVTASNKKEGKQVASQLMLAKLHPHITNFGAFIKLYGNSSIKSVKEKKQEEQQITTLQSKASANSPNWAILSKLKEQMLKLTDKKSKVNKCISLVKTLGSRDEGCSTSTNLKNEVNPNNTEPLIVEPVEPKIVTKDDTISINMDID